MIRALPALLIAACVASPTPPVDLGALVANASAYDGQVVRTCGWARNGFEDQSISVAQQTAEDGQVNPGLTVVWLDSARRTGSRAEWRCITGRVEPVCPDLAPGQVCVTNASPYWDWQIVQRPG